ncbi:MAG TPA: hypothetical protein DCE33_01170 [Rhodospirillaceae bacterium]|nr:hypothetical protein [Rhodospirillaceae bacterium]
MADLSTCIHATTVAIDGKGVLFQGASGSGKSDLALRLIDDGAILVADDQTSLRANDGTVLASAPAELTGRLEVRGIGIVEVPDLAEAPIKMAVLLETDGEIDRLPDPTWIKLCDVEIPQIALRAFEASAVAKLKQALRNVGST